MAYTKLIPRYTKGARVEEISRESSHYLLSIPVGKADQYRLAQLDDYTKFRREQFPLRFPVTLNLSARTSGNSIPGTWGFGLWNDPFGLSFGFGGNPLRLPALPNAVWFFGASEESYLSFRAERNEVETKREPHTKSLFEDSNSIDDRPSSSGLAKNTQPSAQREIAANGFLAQSFRAPKFHPSLILAGLAFPFSRTTTRRLLGRVIDEDGVNLRRDKRLLVPTEWHRYRIDWHENGVSFLVDGVLVFASHVSPHPPLGLVIWIDNQYAAFTPEGRIGFGVLENPEPAWLEVKDIDIKSTTSTSD